MVNKNNQGHLGFGCPGVGVESSPRPSGRTNVKPRAGASQFTVCGLVEQQISDGKLVWRPRYTRGSWPGLEVGLEGKRSLEHRWWSRTTFRLLRRMEIPPTFSLCGRAPRFPQQHVQFRPRARRERDSMGRQLFGLGRLPQGQARRLALRPRRLVYGDSGGRRYVQPWTRLSGISAESRLERLVFPCGDGLHSKDRTGQTPGTLRVGFRLLWCGKR